MSFKDRIARRLVKTSLRLSFKLPSVLPLPVNTLRSGMELSAQLFRVRQDVRVERLQVGGVQAECLTPADRSECVILHFHGGAFFTGSARTHRAMGAEIAARSHATVYMLDYRLAPEHPYPAALEDGLAAYQALLAQGHAAESILLGGDSGGCAHILSLAIALREQGLPLPAGLIMISPYVDITLSLPSVWAKRFRDPMVTAYALRRGSDAYRGRIPASDPRISPLFADLRHLPPVLIQAGTEEILHDDALHLARQLNASAVEVDCRIHKGMWHNFQMFSGVISEADAALDDIAAFTRRLAGRRKSAALATTA